MNTVTESRYFFKTSKDYHIVMTSIPKGVLRTTDPWWSLLLKRKIKACTGVKSVIKTAATPNSPQWSESRKVWIIVIVFFFFFTPQRKSNIPTFCVYPVPYISQIICQIQPSCLKPGGWISFFFFFFFTSEILEEIQQTVYVTEGSSFEYECLGEFTNSKWSFEASNATARRISAVRMKTQNLWTSNKSIHIANVEGAHVGRYTCWTSRCGGQRHKLLTINLCVMTGKKVPQTSIV